MLDNRTIVNTHYRQNNFRRQIPRFLSVVTIYVIMRDKTYIKCRKKLIRIHFFINLI